MAKVPVIITIWNKDNDWSAMAPEFPTLSVSANSKEKLLHDMAESLVGHIIDAREKGSEPLQPGNFLEVLEVDVPDDLPPCNGELLREWRKQLGKTQSELAEMLDVTTQTVCVWEKSTDELKGPIKLILRQYQTSHQPA